MADYWKSQPRKFCQYCKCWIADNKPSVEFHERGKNHKENVAAKITEIKKKSVQKAKQEEKMSKQFAAMEEAALKAYEEDLKRMGREADGSSSPVRATPQPQPQPRPQVRTQPKKSKKKAEKASRKSREPAAAAAQLWVEGLTDDGHTYYYNTVTGESKWEKPADFQGESSAPAQFEQPESSSGSAWMEAVSPDGYTYYYNTETGESIWEKPADFPSNEASGSSKEEESQEEPTAPEPEPLSAAEESSNGASQEAKVPEQADQEPKVPKINFRKRKAETELLENQDDKSNDDVPKEGEKETETKEEESETKPAEAQSSVAEAEKKEVKMTPVEIRIRRPKANPYGAWEKIRQEEDPYASVDLQLPQVEEDAAGAPDHPPPEPKPKFKERVVTSLGDESGPASFRRNKTQNGKSRSLRQRDNDD